MHRNAAGIGLLGVVVLTWGLYLAASEALHVAGAQRLQARVVSVQHFEGQTSTHYVGARLQRTTTPGGSITTFALPNGTECHASGDWGHTGAPHAVYVPRGSSECFAISPMDFGFAGAIALVGLVMVTTAFRQLRARATADAMRAAKT